MTTETMTVSYGDYKKLVSKYKKAVEQKKESFLFKERELVTGYAKYLIEYLTPKFKSYGDGTIDQWAAGSERETAGTAADSTEDTASD
jgi:uncharacterized protein YjbJ (UPF0337 family)